jgi:hypothetical protein
MRKAALLLVLATTGCASSDWARTESVPGGKLYVPKLYAPLLPGSIYPNKKVPIPARARPAMVLVCPTKGDCREREILDQAAQRGLVVLVAKQPEASIAPRPEVDPARSGTLTVTPAALKVEVPTPAKAESSPSSPSKRILLAALMTAEPLEAGDETVLKLYSSNNKGLLPSEAFRDAVEWLAGELGAR